MKCIFGPLANTTCDGCRRRGSRCISQEFSEEPSISIDKSRKIISGGESAEVLADQLVEHAPSDNTIPSGGRSMIPSHRDGSMDNDIPAHSQSNSEFAQFPTSDQYSTVCIQFLITM